MANINYSVAPMIKMGNPMADLRDIYTQAATNRRSMAEQQRRNDLEKRRMEMQEQQFASNQQVRDMQIADMQRVNQERENLALFEQQSSQLEMTNKANGIGFEETLNGISALKNKYLSPNQSKAYETEQINQAMKFLPKLQNNPEGLKKVSQILNSTLGFSFTPEDMKDPEKLKTHFDKAGYMVTYNDKGEVSSRRDVLPKDVRERQVQAERRETQSKINLRSSQARSADSSSSLDRARISELGASRRQAEKSKTEKQAVIRDTVAKLTEQNGEQPSNQEIVDSLISNGYTGIAREVSVSYIPGLKQQGLSERAKDRIEQKDRALDVKVQIANSKTMVDMFRVKISNKLTDAKIKGIMSDIALKKNRLEINEKWGSKLKQAEFDDIYSKINDRYAKQEQAEIDSERRMEANISRQEYAYDKLGVTQDLAAYSDATQRFALGVKQEIAQNKLNLGKRKLEEVINMNAHKLKSMTKKDAIAQQRQDTLRLQLKHQISESQADEEFKRLKLEEKKASREISDYNAKTNRLRAEGYVENLKTSREGKQKAKQAEYIVKRFDRTITQGDEIKDKIGLWESKEKAQQYSWNSGSERDEKKNEIAAIMSSLSMRGNAGSYSISPRKYLDFLKKAQQANTARLNMLRGKAISAGVPIDDMFDTDISKSLADTRQQQTTGSTTTTTNSGRPNRLRGILERGRR